ncbi:hypothetical protein [Streptomyces sp. HC307]|uniref:hypothetical protein n=1 Tax=Streptomyces flavusporus TaxID=3385496 RepID=UPI00391741F0
MIVIRDRMWTMDQGVAAVLGAAVGVVGTLGTAVFTYAATRAQTRDAGMVEHGHWLREKRLVACSAFLEALTQVQRTIDSHSDLDVPDIDHHGDGPLTASQREALRTAARLFEEQAELLTQARAGVDQFGPGRLAKLSNNVVQAVRDAAFELRLAERRGRPLSDETRIAGIMTKWEQSEEAFRAGVRVVMETPPQRRRLLRR